ncbi:ATP-dependent RNA helicase [Monoraphidium neglectum]|uniref:RNA helicase n=1 Tax=Monoraphidium neglectum TaxID=145388 RepID=A0A0D2JB07_9CHLO|nr:ATP-dependent RNA helicase [Monoraphidium neglectum]KIY96932.1 ATP-dependent RNA helicase [Monoraphidium neglectum]|eukprot:XP_013895952.1 ATP-dependent RNA helicase [Monoraphidium neglectum]
MEDPFEQDEARKAESDAVFGKENTGINFDAYEDIPVETSGHDVPAHVDTFEELDLGEGLMANIRRCKYTKPTPVQKYAIPIGLGGRDMMACAQTGSGKTAAFCFPIIAGLLKSGYQPTGRQRKAFPAALVLAPTRELTSQIFDEARKFSYQSGIRPVVIYGGAPVVNQLREIERGCDILVATPGRLSDLIERARVSLSAIRYLALDEADRMLDMGFEPQIRRIVEGEDMPPAGHRQTMLFSATFPKEIQRLAADFLHDYIFLTVGRVGSSTDLIAQHIEYMQPDQKKETVLDCVNTVEGLTLVFVETKRGADQLEDYLLRHSLPATSIHGDKTQAEREMALRAFRSGKCRILVATDVAARGLDIPHVTHVINYDLPKDIDDYVHRIGRTGRAGKKGLATAFFTDEDIGLARSLNEGRVCARCGLLFRAAGLPARRAA